MKKILFVTTGALPVPSVNGGAVEKLVDMLLQDKKITDKFDIDVYSRYDKKSENIIKNYNVRYINEDSVMFKIKRIIRFCINKLSNKYYGNEYITQVVKDIKKNNLKYDIVVIENSPEYALILKKYLKCKFVLHLHNDYLNKERKLSKEIVYCYDLILAISNYIKNRVLEVNSNANVKVLYNGVNLNKFDITNIDNRKYKEKYLLNDDDFVFGYVGRIVKEKGIKELVKSFCDITTGEKTKLLIVGSSGYGKDKESEYLREVKDIARKKEGKIIFTGFVNHDEMQSVCSLIDVGVYPSRCNEAFGLSVAEMLALEKPVIVSDRGALPEIVNYECAIIVKDDDNFISNLKEALNKVLLMRKDEFKDLKKNARKQVLKFSDTNYCNNMIDYLEKI